MSIGGYKVIGPLTYMGKEGCEDVRCRRMLEKRDDGTYEFGPCMGWHCSYCDAACGSQGHRCDASQAVLGEAARVAREDRAAEVRLRGEERVAELEKEANR